MIDAAFRKGEKVRLLDEIEYGRGHEIGYVVETNYDGCPLSIRVKVKPRRVPITCTVFDVELV